MNAAGAPLHWRMIPGGEDAASVARYRAWAESAGIRITLAGEHDASGEERGADALFLIGGRDVDPARYGAPAHPLTRAEPRRDEWEIRAIHLFLEKKRPIFGVCRGLQVTVVAWGGGLVQHLPDLIAPERERHQTGIPGEDARHSVCFDPSTELGAALSNATEVNSSHHQAADPLRLPAGLRVAARTPAGVIEALESSPESDAPVSLVQWHPERLPTGHPGREQLLAHWIRLSRKQAR